MKRQALTLSKFLAVIILTSLVFSSAQFGFLRASAIPNFPFTEIIARIQNISPADNGSYIGDAPLNVSIRFSARSYAPNSSLIPYKEISCIYQLDNGEWKNASLCYASEQGAWYDPTFQGYWNQLDCNYSAVLQGLANGAHSLNVSLTPDLQYYYRVLSNGSSLFYSVGHYVYDALANSTINFYVSDNYDKPAPTDQTANMQQEPFPIILAVAVSVAVVAIFAVGVLAYFKKGKRPQFKT